MRIKGKLHCASCFRSEGLKHDCVETASYREQKWCVSCANIIYIDGRAHVLQPSPGQMVDGSTDDPLVAWNDCFLKAPKKRILKRKAMEEIHREWAVWDGGKEDSLSQIKFYLWLERFRPYFLTFRSSCDRWQTVNVWLLQYVRKAKRLGVGTD